MIPSKAKWTRCSWCPGCERWVVHWSDGSVTIQIEYPGAA
jgi:hypothetical protein